MMNEGTGMDLVMGGDPFVFVVAVLLVGVFAVLAVADALEWLRRKR